MKNIILFAAVLMAFSSCEEEPIPIPDPVSPSGDKTVLIEDFTGVSCPNCPEGARIIEDLKETYGKDRIISIAVHSLGFHELHAQSQYEFRTDDGQEMQDALGDLFSKPAAAINRTTDPANGSRFYQVKEKWPEAVASELDKASTLNMSLNLDYNESSRELDIVVNIVPTITIDVLLSLTVVINENGLIDPQSDLTEIVQDYVHDHILRDVITAPTGDAIGDHFVVGEVYQHSYHYTIPLDDDLPWWNAGNCEIVAFVAEATTDSRQVLEVIKEEL